MPRHACNVISRPRVADPWAVYISKPAIHLMYVYILPTGQSAYLIQRVICRILRRYIEINNAILWLSQLGSFSMYSLIAFFFRINKFWLNCLPRRFQNTTHPNIGGLSYLVSICYLAIAGSCSDFICNVWCWTYFDKCLAGYVDGWVEIAGATYAGNRNIEDMTCCIIGATSSKQIIPVPVMCVLFSALLKKMSS